MQTLNPSVIYRTQYILFHSTVASLTIIVRPPVIKSLEGILKTAVVVGQQKEGEILFFL